jgi:glycine cleavage system aminomethyltransferase T
VTDPFPSAPAPTVTRLEPDDVPVEVVDQLRTGAVVAPADVGIIDLTGPSGGAVTCFQGLLTSDIEKPGDGAFVYGALLTPKGMIVVDGWAARLGARVRFTVPAEGRERALQILQRSVPPRLARTVDRSAPSDTAVLRVAGAHVVAVLGAAGLPIPQAANHVVEGTVGDIPVEVARAGEPAPFSFQITTAAEHRDAIQARLVKSGAHSATSPALELARILAGWPRLASEVDEKTIPQEVRFDEPAAPATGWGAVMHDERDVGRVTSIAWLPDGGGSAPGGGRWIGLAIVRREVPPGAVVRAAGREARIVTLPFDVPSIRPA